MKLTQDERYTAYCIMLAEASTPKGKNFTGFCYLNQYIFDIWGFGCFPELAEKQTGRYLSDGTRWSNGNYRFKNWKERIAALKQCIAETENF